MTRLTLDLDDCKLKKLESTAKLFRKNFPECIVRYRVSASGTGGHVVVFGADKYFTKEEILNARALFDHDRRLILDIKNDNLLPTGILFTQKKSLVGSWKKEAGSWIEVGG